MTHFSPLDEIFDKVFDYAKKLAQEYYFKTWSKRPPHCPAFGGESIHISREGWEHLALFHKRTRFELLGRFFALERAKQLLETATHFQDHTHRGEVEFWSFEAEVDGAKIKVIVRSVHGGSKHFYSVIRKGSVHKEMNE